MDNDKSLHEQNYTIVIGDTIVIGALNLDICGIPAEEIAMHDSAPGAVSLVAGGVGHNIAKGLAANGIAVELFTLLGDDYAANMLSRFCAAEDIGLAHAKRFPMRTPAYMAIEDTGGRMIAAINDMTLLDSLSPELLSPILPIVNASALCVCDANPPAETLHMLVKEAAVPILLDPVSGIKAEKVRPFIGGFTAIKPNRLEAQHLSGESDPPRMAEWFLAQGVKQVYISLGADGLYFASSNQRGYLPAVPLTIKNDTGAGDALTAGIALGMLQGANAQACAQMGIRTAADHLLKQGGIPK